MKSTSIGLAAASTNAGGARSDVAHEFSTMAGALGVGGSRPFPVAGGAPPCETELSFAELLLENLPIGLLVVDPEARIIFLNENVERMLGYKRDELIAQTIEILVPERLRTQHAYLRQMFARAPHERPMGLGQELLARRHDGSEIAVEIGLKPIEVEGRSLVLAVMVDITERKRIDGQRRLMIRELNHRIQNMFAVIHATALHSLGGNRSLLESREVFIERLLSLGRVCTLMTEQEWRGAPLREILISETAAFNDRVRLDGIDLMVRQRAAQSFTLLLHELTINAVKYGALSVPAGRVDVRWTVDREDHPGQFVLSWEETGGPVVVSPTRTGFGRKIIEDTMRRIGKYQIEYAPSGLKYQMEAPIKNVGWVMDEEAAHPEWA